MDKEHICNLHLLVSFNLRVSQSQTHSHLNKCFRNRSGQTRNDLGGQHFAKSIELRLPDSHAKSNDCADDVNRSASVLQSKWDEYDTSHSKTSTVRRKGVVQFVVGDAEFFIVDLPDDRSDVQAGKVRLATTGWLEGNDVDIHSEDHKGIERDDAKVDVLSSIGPVLRRKVRTE